MYFIQVGSIFAELFQFKKSVREKIVQKIQYTIFFWSFYLNQNNSANINATGMKHILLCSQEQDLSFYLRNTLVENRSMLYNSRAKPKNIEKTKCKNFWRFSSFFNFARDLHQEILLGKNLRKFSTPAEICASFLYIFFRFSTSLAICQVQSDFSLRYF